MRKLIFVTITIILNGCLVTQRNSEHIGNVIKITQSGAFCPTWEFEIIRNRNFINGFTANQSTVTSGNPEWFTITNTEQLNIIKDAMETQKEIKVISNTEFFTICRSDSHNQFVESITIFSQK